MKAFSFLTILESLSKKLSILRTKMHSNNLRVDYESITSQLRVSRPFSRTSFGLSRRASHFAAILTILFTIGVGSVWGEETVLFDSFTNTTASNYFKNYTVDGKTVTVAASSTTISSSNGDNFCTMMQGTPSNNNDRYVELTVTGATIKSVSVLITGNGENKECQPALLGWKDEIAETNTANYVLVPNKKKISNKGLSNAQWHQFDVHGNDLTKVRIYRAVKGVDIAGESTNKTTYGNGQSLQFYGIRVELELDGVTKPTFSPATGSSLVKSTGTVTLTSSGNTVYYKWSQTDNQYASGAGATLAGAADGSGTSPVNTTAPSTAGTWYLYAVAKNGGDYSNVVKATYTITNPTHTVTAATDNASYGTAAAASTTVAEGATTTITATPKTGYQFDHWTVSGTGATLSSTSTNPTTLTMGTANATVTAYFVVDPCSAWGYGTANTTAPSSGNSVTVGDLTVANVGCSTSNTTPFSGGTSTDVILGNGSSKYITGTLGGDEIESIRFSIYTTDDSKSTYVVAFSSSATYDAATVLKVSGDYTAYFYNDAPAATGTRKDVEVTAPARAKSFAIGRNLSGVSHGGTEQNSGSRGVYYIAACPAETPTYTVTYETNGGSAVAQGTELTALPNPLPTTTRTGYTFEGWYADSEFNTPAVAGATLTANTTLYAKWTVNSYTVSFDLQGHGSTIDAQTINYGAKATQPTAPTATGYTFGGWYKEAGCTNAWNFETDVVTSTTTLYAKWNCTAPTDVKISGEYVHFPGETLTLTVSGSNIAANATYTWKKGDQVIAGQKTATLTIDEATIENAGNYTCTISNGGSCEATANFTVKMYSLRGLIDWSTDCPFTKVNATTATYSRELDGSSSYEFKIFDGSVYYGNTGGNPTMTSANCTNWPMQQDMGNNVTLQTTFAGTYTFTLDYTDASNPTISVTYPQKQMVYLNPNMWDAPNATEVYTIYSWNENGNAFTVMTKVNECENIYQAEINIAHTQLLFIRGGQAYNSWDGNRWNQSIDLTCQADGLYTIDAWDNTSNLIWKDGALKSWASGPSTYTPATYSITFNGNENTGGSMTNVTGITCGGSATLTQNAFTRTGYTFAGWSTSANGDKAYDDKATISNITSNITLYAKWNAITYNITFDKENGTGGTTQVTATYNSSTIASITNPTRECYTFEGWYSGDNGTGSLVINTTGVLQANVSGYTGTNGVWIATENKTLYAKWTKNATTLLLQRTGSEATPAGGVAVGGDAGTLNCIAEQGTIASYQWKQNTRGSKDGAVNAVGTGATTANFSPKPTAAGSYWYYCVATDECGNEVETTLSGCFLFKALYTVTFNSNNGSVDPTSATQSESGAAIILPTPTRSGYMFTGWYTAASGGTKIGDAGDSYIPTANITLYAQWEHVLVFNLPNDFNGTTQEWSVSYTLSEYLYVLVEVPEETSNGNVSWKGSGTSGSARSLYMYTNGDLDDSKSFAYSKSYVSQTFGSSNIITIGRKHYLKFSTKDDWKAANVKIELTTPCTAPTNAVINGGGTYNSGTNITLTVTANNITNGTTTYTWYRSNSGQEAAITAGPIQVASTNNTYVINSCVQSDAQVYYCLISNGDGCNVVASTSIAINVVTTYTLTYDANAGTDEVANMPEPEQHTPGTYTLSDLVPTRTGYTFAGWNRNPEGTGDNFNAAAQFTTGALNETLYAKWTCTTPTISTQPINATYTQNTAAAALSVTATANDGTLSYQWQSSTDNSNFTNISGATGNEYTPSTTEVGTTYYRCVVTNTTGGCSVTSASATITVTAASVDPEPGECENLIKYDLSQQNPDAKDTETEVATTDENGSGIYKLNGNDKVDDGYKLVNAGDYIGVELSSGNFQAGDKVTIYLTKESGTQGHTYLKIFNRKDPSSAEHVLGTIETPVVGENIFTLTSETKYIYVARTSTFNQNPFIKYISVCRPTTPDTPEGSYTLTYDENKPAVWNNKFAVKNIPEEQTLTDGTGNVSTNTPVITEAANSDYAIYYFAGWNTAADGTGKSYDAGDEITITENTILYAQWTPRTFDVKYFDQDRTTPLEGMVNTTYTFGVGIPTLPTPTKPGHTFIKWIAFWDGGEREVTQIEQTAWGVLQLAAQWTQNCTMPTTTFANGRYVIGSGALDLRTLIADNNSEGEITYAVTGGVAATINGYSFTCDRIGVVTVTATQAANGGNCEKIMTATINVAMPVEKGCAQMFTFDANDKIANPDGQKGQKYLDLSSYATINGLSTTGKVGIKDMTTNTSTNTTLIQNSEIYFPNTNTYLKVENLSTPLAAGDVITIGTGQSATEYIITISGTQCKSNCITTAGQQFIIPAESSLIGVTTFYIWSANAERYLNTINICRPAYTITYKANNGTEEVVESENAVLVAGCPNTFTVPAGKQFAGWNTAADGKGTSYSVGTIIPVNELELYAQWKCIEPVFTVSCDKTAYAKDEEDVSPITVSVTAGNSGGVTYQWFASDKNDRTTGAAIPGATAASYTPINLSTAGTTYYWCEISNSCTTVKTPTIAITVTVTKNNANVEWTNPTGVNYGGGGYSISATVNAGWNGTLLPSMLTAPTGINLYDIEINGKTITAKFDVTTTFDRTADKIPFVLTLPETTTYNPKVSENKVSYDACDNGGGTKHRIPVKETSVQQDINPYNRWDTENIGWITWDQGGGTISSESATYNNFSYRTKSGKQVILIYSKIQEVKTIRIYGYGSNATECTAVSVGKEYNKYTKLSASEYAFNGNTINNRENGVIEISFTTPLKEGTYVQFNFSKNALFYGVELETEGGEEIVTTLSFATAEEIKRQNDANFTNKATPSNNTLGTITYSSSNTDIATVNSTTGEVSIITAGTTTITATLAPSGCYTGAMATYTLTVTEQTCTIAAGTLTASKTDKYDCEAVTLTLSNYEQGATIEWWHNGEAIASKPGITINGNTLTTTLEGTYSALVTKGCDVRSNSVTITNIASASATPLVSEWYIKSGRLTPPIALWKLEGGARIAGVGWMRGEEVSTAPYDNSETAIYEENGIVYLTGTPPQANETGEDIRYTIQLSIYNSCDDSPMVVPSTITIVHQKNTDKHVLAFVVTGTQNGGFTEGITTAQTTNVALYNEISQVFDVLATNIYATDNEQLLKEYYSRFDIICITDYPNTKETGVNGKSYTNAMGALIDIRPILSMEAWVSKYSNWNDKGVTGDPKSPTTRQYSMLLQCKDHEIFAGTNLIQEGSGDELMYRVTMVDATKEDYVTLDKVEENPHQEKEGYKYGSNPALQGFTYTSAMSSMLPIGIIDDGDGNNLQVGLERQYEIEARMIVLGVNSYAMERLTDDGERVIVNTLKYLMKKQSSEIADCSIYFDNNNGKGDNQWNNPANWAPSRNSLPHASQEARILAPCIVSDVVAKVASIKIVPDGKYAPAYNGGIDAKGSLTIAPDGALVVGGHIQAATAPNYLEARPTTPENLIVQADATGSGALIHGEENGELGATVELVSKAYSVKEYNAQTGKYKKKKYWQYVALPVREALAEDAFWGAYTYQYDEAKGWIKKGTGERIEEFWGVGLSIDNEVYSGANNEQALTKFTIKGNLALAIDRDIDLTKTTGAGEGQNMIGNSWTAPIHLTSMTADDFENATATVYIYNTGRDDLVQGYDGTASSANGSTQAGQWISIPVAATALNPWQGPKVIPAMQAFEVDLEEGKTSGILHLNYDKHVRTIATPEEENLPLRAPKYPSNRPSMIRLRVADSTTYTDLYLIEGDQFTDEFDNAWDGKYQPCDGRSATLYAMSPIGDMAVLAQQSVNNTSVVFEPGKKSEYVFTFGYDGDVTYYLNDMQLKTSTEIKEGNEYRFTYNKGDMKNRFLVTRESFDSPNISTGLANIVTDGNGLQVTNPNQENLQVILIDAAGRLCSIYNTAEPMFNIELPATQGVYMINVKGETTNIVRKVVK